MHLHWWFAPGRWLDFSGRASRRELLAYWLVVLGVFYLLPALVIAALDPEIERRIAAIVSDPGSPILDFLFGGFAMLYMVGVLVPLLAVKVRRLHDHEKSGWYLSWGLLPMIGGLILFVLLLLPGDDFENLYGPDPRGREGPLSDAFDRFF